MAHVLCRLICGLPSPAVNLFGRFRYVAPGMNLSKADGQGGWSRHLRVTNTMEIVQAWLKPTKEGGAWRTLSASFQMPQTLLRHRFARPHLIVEQPFKSTILKVGPLGFEPRTNGLSVLIAAIDASRNNVADHQSRGCRCRQMYTGPASGS